MHARTSPARLFTYILATAVVTHAAGVSAQAPSLESLLDPEAAVVARLDVARLRSAPSYRAIENVLAETLGDAGVTDEHARAVLARVDECVVSARTDDLSAERVLLLARGRFTLDDSARLLESPGVAIETRGNHRVMRRGRKAAVFVGTDRFVFGNAELVLAALDRIDGRARRAPFTNATVARLAAQPSRAARMLSVVGVVSGELASQLAAEAGSSPIASTSAFAVEMDLASQLTLEIALEQPDAAVATESAAALSALAAEAARMPVVRTLGLTNVVRALRVRAQDRRVTLSARLRDADVRRLVAMLASELGPTPRPTAPRAR